MAIYHKDQQVSLPQMLIRANKFKEDKMYHKLYLQEKVNRLRAEMALMQDRFAKSQQELQQVEIELKKVNEKDEELSTVDNLQEESLQEEEE